MKRSMGIIIILLMVSSVLGIVFSYSAGNAATEQTFRYGEYVFTLQENLYVTEINDVEMSFYYTPDVVLGADLPQDFLTAYKEGGVLSMTLDRNDSAVEFLSILTYDVTRSLNEDGVVAQLGFTTPVEQLPVIQCDNATSLTIYPHSGDTLDAQYADNCLNLSLPTSADIALYRDALIYSYYGVI